ncbi:MAG: molybdenum cofactor guanylyltransferase [Deltaproteobacteria bacterium]|nr:molybdenum cofactor guanylyltransferase [Deltaproteobacteria bacterium]
MLTPGIIREKDITGVILAGGESRRYGSDKAFVRIEGIPLIERVAMVMQSLFEHVFLITNNPHEYAYLGFPMHEDLIKGLGPLGGIYTAMTAIPNRGGFFVPCDMPFLNPYLIRHMVEIREDYDAVVPRISGMMEALHALYSKQCLPHIKKLIDRREYQIIQLFPKVSVRYVEEAEIRRFDSQLRSFLNINRPEEAKELMS